MSNAISIGFNIHPRWVQGTSLKAFLTPLREAGLDSLEFELDNHLPMWEDFEPLMEETVALGLQLSFHAAYRAPHTLLGYSSGRRDEIQQDYLPLLQIAENWSPLSNCEAYARYAKYGGTLFGERPFGQRVFGGRIACQRL